MCTTESEQANLLMDYQDRIDGLKKQQGVEDRFEALLIITNEIISDPNLSQINTKTLMYQIAEEM